MNLSEPRWQPHACLECLQTFESSPGYRAHDQLDNHRFRVHQRTASNESISECSETCKYLDHTPKVE
jgi:hypothetical protein